MGGLFLSPWSKPLWVYVGTPGVLANKQKKPQGASAGCAIEWSSNMTSHSRVGLRLDGTSSDDDDEGQVLFLFLTCHCSALISVGGSCSFLAKWWPLHAEEDTEIPVLPHL